jgi:DNA invertase Pin-like site-specific DNA recombinase
MPATDPEKQRIAAQYIRMSTDMQRYSIENQAAAIAAYAAAKNIEIVRTYTDAGKSGLQIKGRPALSQLLSDVRLGKAKFGTVLVYDVSRWGRFQDADESAYYEYLCKEAGVTVEYCAEQFKNDNTIVATLLKSIKRVMAAEYSRELSQKVFAGQQRVALKGFHIGSAPVLGLRRCLVDRNGRQRMILEKGERKNIKDDRLILVPGPDREVDLIKAIFEMFIDQKMTGKQIAKELNAREIKSATGRRWNDVSVYGILRNEKYAGANIYNRYSKKLGGSSKRNPYSEWVRVPGAFKGIISPERFSAAQRQLRENANPYDSNELKDYLTALWCARGVLSRSVLETRQVGPSANTYRDHFGGLTKAYKEVGYRDTFIESRPENRRVAQAVRSAIVQELSNRGVPARIVPDGRIHAAGEVLIAVVVGRTPPSAPATHCRWRCVVEGQRQKDVLVVVRSDKTSDFRDYFILPYLYMPRGCLLTMSGRTYKFLKLFRSDDLEPLYKMLDWQELA